MRINWREVFKFLSGAAFAGSLANGCLWLTGMPVPFFSYHNSPTLLGLACGSAIRALRRIRLLRLVCNEATISIG